MYQNRTAPLGRVARRRIGRPTGSNPTLSPIVAGLAICCVALTAFLLSSLREPEAIFMEPSDQGEGSAAPLSLEPLSASDPAPFLEFPVATALQSTVAKVVEIQPTLAIQLLPTALSVEKMRDGSQAKLEQHNKAALEQPSQALKPRATKNLNTQSEEQARLDQANDLLHSAFHSHEEGRFSECLLLAREAESLEPSITAEFWMLRSARRLDDRTASEAARDSLKKRVDKNQPNLVLEGDHGEEAKLVDWLSFFAGRDACWTGLSASHLPKLHEARNQLTLFLNSVDSKKLPLHVAVAKALRGLATAACDDDCLEKVQRLKEEFGPIQNDRQPEVLFCQALAYSIVAQKLPKSDLHNREQNIRELKARRTSLENLLAVYGSDSQLRKQIERDLLEVIRKLAGEVQARKTIDKPHYDRQMSLYMKVKSILTGWLDSSASCPQYTGRGQELLADCLSEISSLSGGKTALYAAVQRYRKAAAAGNHSVELYDKWADCCQRLKSSSQVAEVLRKAFELHPSQERCLKAARAYQAIGENAKARKILQKGIEMLVPKPLDGCSDLENALIALEGGM